MLARRAVGQCRTATATATIAQSLTVGPQRVGQRGHRQPEAIRPNASARSGHGRSPQTRSKSLRNESRSRAAIGRAALSHWSTPGGEIEPGRARPHAAQPCPTPAPIAIAHVDPSLEPHGPAGIPTPARAVPPAPKGWPTRRTTSHHASQHQGFRRPAMTIVQASTVCKPTSQHGTHRRQGS